MNEVCYAYTLNLAYINYIKLNP